MVLPLLINASSRIIARCTRCSPVAQITPRIGFSMPCVQRGALRRRVGLSRAAGGSCCSDHDSMPGACSSLHTDNSKSGDENYNSEKITANVVKHKQDSHYDHPHVHHGHHHHHYPDNAVTRMLKASGMVRLAHAIEHSTACTALSAACFAFAVTINLPVFAALLPSALVSATHAAALCGTFFLSGIPQLVESLSIMSTRQLDTHVLMSLAVFGTLYMGMAHEGALLLLLFRLSHILEEKFTSRAQGSLEALFANVPSKAVLVDLDPSTGAPQLPSARPELAAAVRIGQHVLVKPGEQVPLDGQIVWGTASLSLQHISGESHPVRMGVGSDVPAGSLNTDGLLLVRVSATADDSTPARIARMTAEAQSNKPRLQRVLDDVGGMWSKGVVAATLATMGILPLMGVPLMEPGGAFYRAMGVLTAGSPCAVVLVPLAYVCAIATITRKGVLIKSAGAIDSLAQITTVALDKTGTITSGQLTLSELSVLSLPAGMDQARRVGLRMWEQRSGSSGSGSDVEADAAAAAPSRGGAAAAAAADGPASTRPAPHHTNGASAAAGGTASGGNSNAASGYATSSSSSGAATATAVADEFESTFGEDALRFAVALSRASNHPVSRAMVDAGARLDGGAEDVAVSDFKQVPGLGVQGICRRNDASGSAGTPGGTTDGSDSASYLVHFGSADFIREALAAGPESAGARVVGEHLDREVAQYGEELSSRALSFLTMVQLPAEAAAASSGAWGAAALPQRAASTGALGGSSAGLSGSSSSLLQGLSPCLSDPGLPAAAAGTEPGGITGSRAARAEHRFGSGAGSSSGADEVDAALFDDSPIKAFSHSSGRRRAPSSAGSVASSVTGSSWDADSPGSRSLSPLPRASAPSEEGEDPCHQQQQHDAVRFDGSSSSSAAAGSADAAGLRVAVFHFEDRIAPGTRSAVSALQAGAWHRGGQAHAGSEKDVVMLTGDNARVAEQVAAAMGITHVLSGLRPEEKLAYVQGFKGKQGQALMMVGDGINDAPALAAAHVGVAIASTPSDMVAAASDVIILNGRGVANLPWMFRVAHRTQRVVRQNLVLALAAVVCATLPTLAGVFPLWLAVLLHEGSTLLVALNSLRLLMDPDVPSIKGAAISAAEAVKEMFSSPGHHHHHHGHHDHDHGHGHDHHSHGHGHCGHDHSHHHHQCHDHSHHGHDHSHGHGRQGCSHSHGHGCSHNHHHHRH